MALILGAGLAVVDYWSPSVIFATKYSIYVNIDFTMMVDC